LLKASAGVIGCPAAPGLANPDALEAVGTEPAEPADDEGDVSPLNGFAPDPLGEPADGKPPGKDGDGPFDAGKGVGGPTDGVGPEPAVVAGWDGMASRTGPC
jgi:hypothetical protein